MKLLTLRWKDATAAARVDGDRAVVLERFADVGEVLRAGAPAAVATLEGPVIDLDAVDYAPVILSPSKIVCVGLNYRAHILEMKRDLPEYPVLFAKFADTLAAAGEEIALPAESPEVDWEGELAVVIGSTVRRASAEQAEDAIAGYTIANDVSMRDWQFRTREWLQGKMWERSTPLGPVLATPEEIPSDARMTTTVDGVPKQVGDIHDLVHGPVDLVRYVSTITTLRPGDVILTGTREASATPANRASTWHPEAWSRSPSTGSEPCATVSRRRNRDRPGAQRSDPARPDARGGSAARAAGGGGAL